MSAVSPLQRLSGQDVWFKILSRLACTVLLLTAEHCALAQNLAEGPPPYVRPFSRIGFDVHGGFGGMGLDVATPLSRTLNVRAGSDFFDIATGFQEQGVAIGMKLDMQSSHASLDWFPFSGKFRISPLAVFGNANHLDATASVPRGDEMSLSGSSYVSSIANPLHGTASVDFRRIGPGVTLGFGNIVPRITLTHRPHFSFPSEAGFYYVGQPSLNVDFSGSVCTPTLPQSIGCGSVVQNATFQQGLATFEARTNKNLRYVSFFPIFSAGIGYAF